MKPYEFYKKGVTELSISDDWDFFNGRGENGVVDQYGNVTIIALVGVLFIALGFIVAFVMLGGMS